MTTRITVQARPIPAGSAEEALFDARTAEHDASVKWQNSAEAKCEAAREYEQAKKEQQ